MTNVSNKLPKDAGGTLTHPESPPGSDARSNSNNLILQLYINELKSKPGLTGDQVCEVSKRMEHAAGAIAATLSTFPPAVGFMLKESRNFSLEGQALSKYLGLIPTQIGPGFPDRLHRSIPQFTDGFKDCAPHDNSQANDENLNVRIQRQIEKIEFHYENLIHCINKHPSKSLECETLRNEISAAFNELRFSPLFLRKIVKFSRILSKRIINDWDKNEVTCQLDKYAESNCNRTLQADFFPSRRTSYYSDEIRDGLATSTISRTLLDISLSYGVSPITVRTIIGKLDRYEKQWIEEKNQLVEANLRLVIYLAKQCHTSHLELADLIQDGNIGLLKAVDKFDYRLGFRFSTYAAFWIQQGISRTVASKDKTIRLPFRFQQKLYSIGNASRHLNQVLNRKPTDREIAQKTEIPEKWATRIIVSSQKMLSLDSDPDDEDSPDIMRALEQSIYPPQIDLLSARALKRIFDVAFRNLDSREARVLTQRFGIHGGNERTLQDLAHEMNLTRERIRQIQAEALKKLRRRYTPILQSFLSLISAFRVMVKRAFHLGATNSGSDDITENTTLTRQLHRSGE